MPKSKEELLKELQMWEDRKFQNMLVDHWHTEEFMYNEECNKHVWEIKQELKKIEEEGKKNG